MKTYRSQPNDSFASIAKKFNIKDEHFLRTFHNLNCAETEVIYNEIPPGTSILIPEDPQFLISDEYKPSHYDFKDSEMQGENNEEKPDHSLPDNETFEEPKENDNSSGNHDGKHFVIQKGSVQCNQGFTFPKFKVTSHNKHYWNDADGQQDHLAVTEDDIQFAPSSQPFGQCRLRPCSGGYLPCVYTPSGKWINTYDKVKVMDKSCVTEISVLMCSTGGEITVLKHGQQSELGKSNVNHADSAEQQLYNPVLDFEEFKEEIKDTDELYYT